MTRLRSAHLNLVSGSNIRGAAMQQIADWLKKLGLSEYAERFAGAPDRVTYGSPIDDRCASAGSFGESLRDSESIGDPSVDCADNGAP